MTDAPTPVYYLVTVRDGEIDLHPAKDQDDLKRQAVLVWNGLHPTIEFDAEADFLFWQEVDLRHPADPAVAGEFESADLIAGGDPGELPDLLDFLTPRPRRPARKVREIPNL